MIGIRVAMGAQPQNVLILVLGQGAKLALAGVAGGLVGTFALALLMSRLVFGVSPRDLPTFSLAPPWFVLALILVACYGPARRAANVDPVLALCEE